MPSRPFTRRFRVLKAYAVTLRVLASYLGLFLGERVLGRAWADRRRPAVHRRNARRVVARILDLKGLFIKIGQLVSILTNFLPEDFRHELEGLQDRIPPRPVDEIEARIRDELGKEPAALFSSFSPVAVASASLAQVHEARLADGRRVAVKVQHWDIEATARLDLRTIRRILALVSILVRIRGLDDQYRQLEAMILDELDFEREAHHIEAIAANFEGDPSVSFPRVVPERSSRRVLTTEYVDGIKVTDLAGLDAYGIDRPDLAERIVRAYCQMIFVDGLYHADPHPGNILVRRDGGIVFLDFGAVARLSPGMKDGLPELIMGLVRRDAERITKAFRQMGFVARDGHEATLHRMMDRVNERLLADLPLDAFRLQDINAEAAMEAKLDMLTDFRKLGLSFRDLTATFQVPKDWILLDRTLLLLMGLCTHLHPEMNPMDTIRPYLEQFVLGPEQDWKKLLRSMLKDVALSVVTLPDEARRLLVAANRGELTVQVGGLRDSARLLYALGHQMLYGLFALGGGALSYLAHTRGEATLSTVLAYGSGFFLLSLGVSMLRARKWQKERQGRR